MSWRITSTYFSSTTEPIITDGLVLRLDAGNRNSYPGSGTTWTDLSGNGNNGTLVNGVGFNGSNLGSLVFDGVNDYVNLTSASLLPVGTSNRTIVAFVRTPSTFSTWALHHIIHWGGSLPVFGTDTAFGLAITSGGRLTTHTWNATPQQGTVAAGTNYCLAVSYTHSSTLHRFWINGVSQGAGVARSINTGTAQAVVGTRISPYEYWGGRIYNVMVYNRSLTDAEVQQNYDALKYRFQ
jgi:hypothetical protein